MVMQTVIAMTAFKSAIPARSRRIPTSARMTSRSSAVSRAGSSTNSAMSGGTSSQPQAGSPMALAHATIAGTPSTVNCRELVTVASSSLALMTVRGGVGAEKSSP